MVRVHIALSGVFIWVWVHLTFSMMHFYHFIVLMALKYRVLTYIYQANRRWFNWIISTMYWWEFGWLSHIVWRASDLKHNFDSFLLTVDSSRNGQNICRKSHNKGKTTEAQKLRGTEKIEKKHIPIISRVHYYKFRLSQTSKYGWSICAKGAMPYEAQLLATCLLYNKK